MITDNPLPLPRSPGNQMLHAVTDRKSHEMRVDLKDHEDVAVYAQYQTFKVGSRTDNYNLSVSIYTGTAGC